MKPYTVDQTPKIVIIHEGVPLLDYSSLSILRAEADAKRLNGAYAKGVMAVMSLLESKKDIKLCEDIIKEVI